MKCHVCGSDMTEEYSDMPFKLSQHKVVIFKDLPVLQCSGCGEFLLADPVMVQVESMLERSMPETELDVMRYAA
ncbi:MAG: YgiT-type zinc finger protein [Mariprofundaceae bacterium]|nr:YgiT-type zinc finger protein [Mariprofundaceae bacterium]